MGWKISSGSALLHELDHLALCPAAVLRGAAIDLSQKRAMTSVRGFNVSDMGIGKNFLPCLRRYSDERIVRGVNNQRGHDNPIYHIGSGRTSVLIRRIGESTIEPCNSVIEAAQAGDSPQP